MKTTEFKNQMREIMSKAWMLVKQYGFSLSEALHQMWQVIKLKKQMHKGVARFVYRKIDGTLRMAWGTLCGNIIPQTAGTGRKPNDTLTTYFDIEKNGFRCFKTANFVEMV